jgi:glycosyltransferase involved in cell wall biosynthesis
MRLSLVVMAYRQEAFIADTVAAAFAQDHPDLEIVLSDDCSPDGTFAIMEAMAAAYTGPHRIVLNRNPQNLGLIGHVNRLFDLATSDWLIYNAGDDLSEPHRARVIAETIARDGPYYLYSNVTDLNAQGEPLATQRTRTRAALLDAKSLPELARTISHALGASSAWHRDLFARFGPIVETDLFEDQVLMFRARLLGKVCYLEDRLLRYRRDIGVSFQSRDDRGKQLRRHLAILNQRMLDVQTIAPGRRDILKSIERKRERRVREIAELLADAGPGPALPDDDED